MDEFGDIGGEGIESFDAPSIEFSEGDFPDMPDEPFDETEVSFGETEAIEGSSFEMAYAETLESAILEEEFPDMPDESPETGGILADYAEGAPEGFPDMPEDAEDGCLEEASEEDLESTEDFEPIEDGYEAGENVQDELDSPVGDVSAAMDDAEAQGLSEPVEPAPDVGEVSDPEGTTAVGERVETAPEGEYSSLSEYMNAHNYGMDDFAEYSRDPEWRRLHAKEFPDFKIPDMKQASDSTEAFPGKVYDAFEQNVMSENPEFYATGRFYQQGINEYGYEGTCGPTSQANALNELFDTNVFTENNILTTAVENSLCETSSENPEDCGGTNTDQFMNLYEKVSEQTGGAFSTELYEHENALDANQVADRLDQGDVVNVAVDSSVLWDQPRDTFDPLGVPQENEGYSDHWITISGVQRDASGGIVGFDIIDSGGGESSVSLDKYNEMCFGSEEYKVIDPTCIVVSKD